jgi:uncharacterized protein
VLKPGPAKRLIITVNESDRWHGHAVFNALLELFRREGLSSATVSRGIAGFTGHGSIHSISLVDLSSDLPVRIEVVDSADAIERVLPQACEMVRKGLVEVQDTMVVTFTAGNDV